MESESKVLGKINKKKCYLNLGKYGHYLTVDSKNYKVPEWLPPEKWILILLNVSLNIRLKCLNNGWNHPEGHWLVVKPPTDQNLFKKKRE